MYEPDHLEINLHVGNNVGNLGNVGNVRNKWDFGNDVVRSGNPIFGGNIGNTISGIEGDKGDKGISLLDGKSIVENDYFKNKNVSRYLREKKHHDESYPELKKYVTRSVIKIDTMGERTSLDLQDLINIRSKDMVINRDIYITKNTIKQNYKSDEFRRKIKNINDSNREVGLLDDYGKKLTYGNSEVNGNKKNEILERYVDRVGYYNDLIHKFFERRSIEPIGKLLNSFQNTEPFKSINPFTDGVDFLVGIARQELNIQSKKLNTLKEERREEIIYELKKIIKLKDKLTNDFLIKMIFPEINKKINRLINLFLSEQIKKIIVTLYISWKTVYLSDDYEVEDENYTIICDFIEIVGRFYSNSIYGIEKEKEDLDDKINTIESFLKIIEFYELNKVVIDLLERRHFD